MTDTDRAERKERNGPRRYIAPVRMAGGFCFLLILVVKTATISAQPPRPDTIYVSRSMTAEAYPATRKLYLGENNPDPFYDSTGTTIRYSAVDVREAWIVVYDAGKDPLAYYRLTCSYGEIEIVRRGWPAGVYTYTLFVDGRMIRKRQMTLR